MTYYQCKMYADSIGFAEFSSEYYLNYVYTIDDALSKSNPKGCQIDSITHFVYFNFDPNGVINSYRQPICVKPETYAHMEAGTTDCTADFEKMTYDQCEAFAASRDQTTFAGYYKSNNDYYQYYLKNVPEFPAGCLLRDDRGKVYFNEYDHSGDSTSNGGSNAGYRPVCIMECQDDLNFRVNDIDHKNCMWIMENEKRRKNKCLRSYVRLGCPITCGVCCADSNVFTFKADDNSSRKCAWIASSLVNRRSYCDQKKVSKKCRKTCNTCPTSMDVSV